MEGKGKKYKKLLIDGLDEKTTLAKQKSMTGLIAGGDTKSKLKAHKI